MSSQRILSKDFVCTICKAKALQNGFVVGLKEAFTPERALMIRLCARCYDQITKHMIYLAKTMPQTDEIRMAWTDADDTAFLREMGISDDE